MLPVRDGTYYVADCAIVEDVARLVDMASPVQEHRH
jgi:hypothetical protein